MRPARICLIIPIAIGIAPSPSQPPPFRCGAVGAKGNPDHMAVAEYLEHLQRMTDKERANQAEPFRPTGYNLPDGDWPSLINPLPSVTRRTSWVMVSVIVGMVVVGAALIVLSWQV